MFNFDLSMFGAFIVLIISGLYIQGGFCLFTYLIVTTGLIISKKATLGALFISAFLVATIYYLVHIYLFPVRNVAEAFLVLPIASAGVSSLHWCLMKELIPQQGFQDSLRMGKQNWLAYKIKFALIALFCVGTVIGIAMSGGFQGSSGAVPLDQRWDISQKNNTLEKTFTVTKFNGYELAIAFSPIKNPITVKALMELKKITGGENSQLYNIKTHEYMPQYGYSDAQAKQLAHLLYTGEVIFKYSEPGVIIPVHFKIEKFDNNKVTKVVIERELDTAGSGGFATHHCVLSRLVALNIKLHPGDYKITISNSEKMVLSPNIETYLQLSPLPDSTPPKDDGQE
jgi:hypothetical protein